MGEAPGFLYLLKAEGAVSGSLSELECYDPHGQGRCVEDTATLIPWRSW